MRSCIIASACCKYFFGISAVRITLGGRGREKEINTRAGILQIYIPQWWFNRRSRIVTRKRLAINCGYNTREWQRETERKREMRYNLPRRRSSRSQTGNRDSGRGDSSHGVITFHEPEMQYSEIHMATAAYITHSRRATQRRLPMFAPCREMNKRCCAVRQRIAH